jgi:hypothetical protein
MHWLARAGCLAAVLGILWSADLPAFAGTVHPSLEAAFPPPLESYQDDHLPDLAGKLAHRIRQEPFNLIATLIFFGAVLHTFAAGSFTKLAHRFQEEHEKQIDPATPGASPHASFKATVFHFLGEIEAIFGIWLIPLAVAMVAYLDLDGLFHYVDARHFDEPVFVVVIMAIASTKPVIALAERGVALVASLGGGRVHAWWLSILCLLPTLGSLITEPAAMTIAALLLGKKFYALNPSRSLKYATLGLLFVSVSIGGTLTHFAAPPVLMVAGTWKLGTPLMFSLIGWKALVSILAGAVLTRIWFRREFARLESESLATPAETPEKIPFWITLIHILFMAWTVLTLHHPALVVGGFLFFLAFAAATEQHQFQVALRGPILVGFFLASLVLHGGLQGWWIQPVLSGLTEFPLFLAATILTAFNDNAAITYLVSQVPAFNPVLAADPHQAKLLEYAVLTGAVTGGGLTVIANAPNPAGQSILSRYFGKDGISPLHLFLGALGPTVLTAVIFCLLRPLSV